MDFVMGVATGFWWYYIVPGIGVSLATWITEAIMLPKSRPFLEERSLNLAALAVAFTVSLWRWPLLFFAAFMAYIKGKTLLITFVEINQSKRKTDAAIRAREAPLSRTWEKRKNAEGTTFHYYVSDFHRADGQPPERRLTHILRQAKGEKVASNRCMSANLDPLPFGVYGGLWEAKWACEKDTLWLDLCVPAKDAQREVAYQELKDRYQHSV